MMDASRFDTISRLFASRKTRRQAIAGTAGLATALAVVPGFAQEATPAGTPLDPNDPHPSADEATRDPEFLFVQPFSSGSWAPKEGADGTYTLTLAGAAANTVYFSDRPDRIFGLAPTGEFLDNLGFTPDNPPNAAIVAQRADGDEGDGQEVLVIELTNPSYDGDSLTYDATVLADYGEHGLAHAARQQQDYEFPESFAEGSLFIDDCPDGEATCFSIVNGERVEYGSVVVGQCYSFPKCGTCFDHDSARAGKMCADAFPDHCSYGSIGDLPGVAWTCNLG